MRRPIAESYRKPLLVGGFLLDSPEPNPKKERSLPFPQVSHLLLRENSWGRLWPSTLLGTGPGAWGHPSHPSLGFGAANRVLKNASHVIQALMVTSQSAFARSECPFKGQAKEQVVSCWRCFLGPQTVSTGLLVAAPALAAWNVDSGENLNFIV